MRAGRSLNTRYTLFAIAFLSGCKRRGAELCAVPRCEPHAGEPCRHGQRVVIALGGGVRLGVAEATGDEVGDRLLRRPVELVARQVAEATRLGGADDRIDAIPRRRHPALDAEDLLDV